MKTIVHIIAIILISAITIKIFNSYNWEYDSQKLILGVILISIILFVYWDYYNINFKKTVKKKITYEYIDDEDAKEIEKITNFEPSLDDHLNVAGDIFNGFTGFLFLIIKIIFGISLLVGILMGIIYFPLYAIVILLIFIFIALIGR